MNMSMRVDLQQVQRCYICKQSSGHLPNCPTGEIETLIARTPRHRCPDSQCLKGIVWPNASDFLECDKCRAQYTCGPYDDGGSLTIIGNRLYRKLKQKGKGEFPVKDRLRYLDNLRNEVMRKIKSNEDNRS